MENIPLKTPFRFGIADSAMMRLNKRMDIKSLGIIPTYFGLIDAEKILRGMNIPSPLSLSGYLIHPVMGLHTEKRTTEGLEMRSIGVFDEAFDELWDNVSEKLDISVIKDAKYLNWRYVDCPGYSYKRLAAYRSGRLEGFIVYRQIDVSCSSFIIELAARNDNPLTMKALLLEAIGDLKINGAGYIRALFPVKSQHSKVLKEMGFKFWGMRFRSQELIIAASFPGDPFPEIDMKNWNYCIGDWVVY